MKPKKNRAAAAALLAALLAGALAACASFQTIEVTRPPSRAVYGQGEDFDKTGMVVGGVTKKGEIKPIPDSRVQISGYDKSRPGVQTVTVAYRDTQTTIQVEVVPVQSVGIENAPPRVKQYENITGLTARVDYGGRLPAAAVGAGSPHLFRLQPGCARQADRYCRVLRQDRRVYRNRGGNEPPGD
jgi:hypothetical protein